MALRSDEVILEVVLSITTVITLPACSALDGT